MTDDRPASGAVDLFAADAPAVVTQPEKVSDRTITADLLARLQRHYIEPGKGLPGGIFVTEVGWNGGGSSRCDAIFVGFTSTSGRIMVGHEVKASRSDWLNELKKAGKADAWADECHAWYVVAPSTAVVKPDELPAGWGLMVPGASKTRMKVAVPAPAHRDREPSWLAVRSVMARYDTLRADAIYDARAKAAAEAVKNVEEQIAQRVARATGADVADRLRQQRDALAAALGCEVEFREGGSYARDNSRTLTEIREAAAFLRAHGSIQNAVEALVGRFGFDAARVGEQAAALTEALAALRALSQKPASDDEAVA